MEFLNKLGKKASEAYKGAAEKTEKLTKEAKLKIKIADYKSKIKDVYEEIGQKVYQKHVLSEEISKEELLEECGKIDEFSKGIEEAENEILTLGNLKQCAKCKEKIDKDAKFCPKCGEEQPEVERKVEQEEVLEGEVVSEDNNSDVENADSENNSEEEN